MELLEKLQELGYELPEAAAPAANYVPYVTSGSHLYVAGQIPFLNGEKMHMGRLGEDLTVERGQAAARLSGLNLLAQMKAACDGDLSRVADEIGFCPAAGGAVVDHALK